MDFHRKTHVATLIIFENLLDDNVHVDRQALVAQGECQLHAQVTS